MNKALIILLTLCALACGSLFYALKSEREKHDATKADNARLLAATSAKDTTIADLQAEIRKQNLLISERDEKIANFNTAAFDAAILIEGADNESPPECKNCNIDAPLPASLSDPLRLLYQQAAGRDSP